MVAVRITDEAGQSTESRWAGRRKLLFSQRWPRSCLTNRRFRLLESRHKFYWDKSNGSGLFEGYRKKSASPEHPARDQRLCPGWMEICVPEFRILTFRAVEADQIFQNLSPSGLVHSLSWIGGQAHLIHLGIRLSTVLWGSWIIRLSDQNCLILAHS